MKLLLLLLALPILFGCDNGNDKRDDNGNVNIPDAIFKGYLIRNSAININGDLEIQAREARSFKGKMNCSAQSISDLTGIQAFTALTELDCHSNQLTSLDVSKNSALTWLICMSNQLTSLDVSKNTALTYLLCGDNQLTSLDVSKNTALTDLYCMNNKLTSLDVSKNIALTDLHCDNNKFDCDALKNMVLINLISNHE